MKKMGVTLIIIASLLWTLFFITSLFIFDAPELGFIISAVIIGIVGAIFILIDVGRDRYQEYKEEKRNDDYRKY